MDIAMVYALAALAAALGFSLGITIWLARRLRAARKQPAPTTEARDLIHDLTRRGAALVKIEVIDPSNIMLRSPRG